MKLIVKCVADDGSEWDTRAEAEARDAELKAQAKVIASSAAKPVPHPTGARPISEWDGPSTSPSVP